ncbi:MAG: hypothetical protein JO112_07840 [Planctomycetes bacterium]|nr:hypothetical protein [Planctomycetota bacterium]
MRFMLTGSLGLALGLLVAGARGQEVAWRPVLGRPVALPQPSPAAEPSTPAVTLGSPLITLGQPIPLGGGRESIPAKDPLVALASFNQPLLDAPQPNARGQNPDLAGPSLTPPPPAPPPGFPAVTAPTPNEQYNCGVVTENPAGPPHHWYDIFTGRGSGRKAFESDHAFDEQFISPVSNPFLFEDPRALTEVRPIFMWQQTPSTAPGFHGGDIEYAGLQARLAVTDWLSFTMSKLGFTWIEAHDPFDGIQNGEGFSEIWLGPKVTFLRCESTGTLLAAGLNFQIPAGSARVFQDTGTLSLEPYLSFGQSFLRSSYGHFAVLDTLGYDFSIDNKRTDYVFDSLHLDYDVANLHKIFPLIEFNYFHYTTKGNSQPFPFEGADLFNFGSSALAQRNLLTMAAGARFKFCEGIELGLVGEFPLTSDHGLEDFRLTADMIFRY